VAQSQAALQAAQSAPAQIAVTTGTAASNAAKIAEAQAAVEEARLQLSYTELRAPADGYVSQKSVEPGQLVQPGQALMVVVSLTGTYVDANFKETQLADIHPGQDAEITADAYPGYIFLGKVKSIASGTGAVFSLLPPENATGNFVKVVQRIPVRIAISSESDPKHLLRLGMSVTATITIKK
jgi:membrane fusion protein, multidrug efflux system